MASPIFNSQKSGFSRFTSSGFLPPPDRFADDNKRFVASGMYYATGLDGPGRKRKMADTGNPNPTPVSDVTTFVQPAPEAQAPVAGVPQYAVMSFIPSMETIKKNKMKVIGYTVATLALVAIAYHVCTD